MQFINFTSGSHSLIYHYLFLPSMCCTGIHKEDEGMYTCRVENQFGLQEVSAFITVTGVGKYCHNHSRIYKDQRQYDQYPD